jgi:hypothetical protein
MAEPRALEGPAQEGRTVEKATAEGGFSGQLIKWTFGEGNEGVFVQPTSGSRKALIVGRGIPWWGMVIARLDLKIHSVLLSDTRFFDLVSDYFGRNVPLGKATELSGSDVLMTRTALRECSVVALESLPKASAIVSEMWSMPAIKLILTAHGKLISPPPGWKLRRKKIGHWKVGGVTDVTGHIGIYTRNHDDGSNEAAAAGGASCRPRRDLRSVLKMGVSGNRCGAPTIARQSTLPIGEKAHEVRPGVMLNSGLLGVKTNGGLIRLPRVKTLFGGDMWVIRSLTTAESMACWDVPEKLGQLAGNDELRRKIMHGMFTPLKIRQTVLENLGPVVNELLENGTEEVRRESDDSVPCELLKRGPTLELITPEEEREIFQDKSDPPVNSLIEELSSPKGDVKDQAKVIDEPTGATKDDKASVRPEKWDKMLYLGLPEKIKSRPWARASRTIRPLIARHWRRMQMRKWIKFVKDKHKRLEVVSEYDRDAARECLLRLQAANFWEWKSGSRPMFWNYPEDQQMTMRDGIVLWMKGRMDPWLVPQRLPRDEADLPKIIEKLCVARDKGYIDVGLVRSLISFFEVPKGLTDIRMVYDGTKSGLNEMLWAPWFPLPTVESLLRSVEPGTWMADNDVGEMFLNFVLHESVQALCGVDLTKYFPDGIPPGTKVLWERWTRCAMGLRPSPYQACQGMMWALEIIFADRNDVHNVFRFERVRLNLPGKTDYNPRRPWVYKERSDGSIANDVHAYVDDLRATGVSESECWEASQRVSSVLASLGIQDAARKRRAPKLNAGAWKGSVVNTADGKVTVLATREKWKKLKAILQWLLENHNDPGGLDHKLLEQKRGFLVHMVQTYPGLNPYLKGVHGTLDSWRRNRDENGFRLPDDNKRSRGEKPEVSPGVGDDSGDETCEGEETDELAGLTKSKRRRVGGNAVMMGDSTTNSENWTPGPRPVERPASMFEDPEDPLSWEEKFGNFNLEKFGESESTRPPKRVRPVKRLSWDIQAMLELTDSEDAPKRSVRPGKLAHAIYGFGDASQDGFGASIEIAGKGIVWRSGTWSRTMREESSNYREFRNLVEMIEELVRAGTLRGHELFMFTDNSTAESAFFKGTSSSEKLFNLVLRLRKIEMEGDLFIHLVHVAGTRMIWSGVDGLSRGDHNAGVMAGESMLSFVPLAQSADERSPDLLEWVRSWAESHKSGPVKILTPTEWCDPHPSGRTYVWVPPPAAAAAAMEWLAQSIHKRPDSVHIVLVPRLMTACWRKRLGKISDLLFTIPLTSKVWPKKNHEPLICSVCLPLSKESPWRHRGSARVKGVRKRMPAMWEESDDASGTLLRELLGQARALGKL